MPPCPTPGKSKVKTLPTNGGFSVPACHGGDGLPTLSTTRLFPPVPAMNPPTEPESGFTRLYRATLQPLRRYLTRLLGNAA